MGLYDWLGYGISHGYYSSAVNGIGDTPHFSVDYGTPIHTPITALFSGTVVKQRTGLPWGTEVFIQPDNTRIPQYYYYHLDTLNTSLGQHVNAGDVLGLSGGQNSGGSNPSTPAMSSGPHTHVGFFTSFVSVRNNFGNTETIPFGPDITPALQALAKGANVANIPNTPGITQTQPSGIPVGTQAFFIDTGQKIGLIVVSLTLLGVGSFFLFERQVKAVGGKVAGGVKTAAKVAVVA